MKTGILVLLLSAGSCISAAATAKECKQIHAEIVSSSTTAGCTSPIGLCTSGTIDGNFGLDGTTYLTTDSFAPGPNTAPKAPNVFSYSGVLQIAARHGTLTARDTGIFDPLPIGTGVFSSFDIITGGTGRYAGASGILFIMGRTVVNTGQFVSTVTGTVCMS